MPSLKFGITADNSSFKKAFDESSEQVGNLSSLVRERMASASEAVRSGMIQAFEELREGATGSLARIEAAFGEIDSVVDVSKEAIKELEAALADASSSGDDGQVAVLQTQIDMRREIISEAERVADALAEEENRLRAQGDAAAQSGMTLREQFNAVIDQIDTTNAELVKLEEEMERLMQLKDETYEAGGTGTDLYNIDQQIKSVQEEIDIRQQLREELGRQTDTLAELIEQEGEATQSAEGFVAKMNGYRDSIVSWATSNGKFQSSLDGLKTAFSSLPVPIAGVANAVNGVIRSLMTMCATPIGAVLAAIALSLKALSQWFTKSEEGQRAFAQVSAYVGSVLSSLGDVVITFGKYLYSIFADAGAPMNDFARNFVNTFKVAAQSVGNLLGGLGNTLKGIFTLDWDTFKSGLSSMWEGVKGAGETVLSSYKASITGMIGIVRTITSDYGSDLFAEMGKSMDGMFDKASRMSEIALEQRNLEMDMLNAKEKQAELDAEISKKYEQIYKTTGKEKQALIEEVKLMKRSRYDEQIALQQKAYDLTAETNSLHASTIEDIKKERELRIQVLTTQAQQAASTRMLARLENSTNKALQRQGASDGGKAWQKYSDLSESNAAARAREEKALEDKVTEARIAAMEDGAEKVRLERRRELEKELDQIEEAKTKALEAELKRQKAEYEAMEKAVGGSGVWDNSKADTTVLDNISAKYDEVLSHVEAKQRQEAMREETEAMRGYLKNYGTYQQQKLAITEEYAEKIAKVTTEGEKLTLERQRDKAIGDVNLSAIKADIDWGGVFGNLGGMLREEMKSNMAAIKEYMKSAEFRSMPASDQSQIVDALNQLKEHIGGDLSDVSFSKLGTLTEEFRKAQRSMIEARNAETAAYERLGTAQENYEKALKSGDEALTESARSELDEARKWADGMSASYQVAVSEFSAVGNNLREASRDAVDAIDGLSSAVSQIKSSSLQSAYKGVASLAGQLSSVIGGKVGKALENVASAMSGTMVGEILESALGLLDLLKDGIGSILADLSDMIYSAINGLLSDILSGDVLVKPLESIYTGAMGILNTLTFGGLSSWLGSGDSDKDYAKDMERLSISIDALSSAISKLSDDISTGTLAEAKEAYDTAKANEATMEAHMQEQMQRSGAAYSNGVFGVGGSHSSDYKINKGMSTEDWKAVSNAAGKSVTSASDFWDLTSEQMAKVAKYAPEMYAKIKELADDGYKDAAQYMDEYIVLYEELEELQNAYLDKLTHTDLSTVQSTFRDLLLDMEADAEDFAESFEQMMQEAIVGMMMTQTYNALLEEWYYSFASAMEDGTLSFSEKTALQDSWNSMMEDAVAMRDALYEAMDFQTGSFSQEASTGAWESMSQDTAGELNGRFTALQIAGESINTQVGQMLALIQSMAGYSTADNANMAEMRNLMVISNSYLEDIARYTKLTYQEIYGKFDEAIMAIKQI